MTDFILNYCLLCVLQIYHFPSSLWAEVFNWHVIPLLLVDTDTMALVNFCQFIMTDEIWTKIKTCRSRLAFYSPTCVSVLVAFHKVKSYTYLKSLSNLPIFCTISSVFSYSSKRLNGRRKINISGTYKEGTYCKWALFLRTNGFLGSFGTFLKWWAIYGSYTLQFWSFDSMQI